MEANNPLSLEHLFKAIGGGGWDDIEKAEATAGQDLEAMRARTLEVAQDIEATFSTEQGRRTLEWICDLTVRRPTWRGGEDGLSLKKITAGGLFREGQNSITYKIIQAIVMAQHR